MTLDCLRASEGVKDYGAASADVHGPRAPFSIALGFKIRLVFPVETSPTQQNLATLETPAHEFNTLQPADATLAVSSITGKEPQVVTDGAGMWNLNLSIHRLPQGVLFRSMTGSKETSGKTIYIYIYKYIKYIVRKNVWKGQNQQLFFLFFYC